MVSPRAIRDTPLDCSNSFSFPAPPSIPCHWNWRSLPLSRPNWSGTILLPDFPFIPGNGLLYATLNNRNLYAISLLLCAPLLFLIAASPFLKTRIYAYICLFGIGFILGLTYSRSVLLALFPAQSYSGPPISLPEERIGSRVMDFDAKQAMFFSRSFALRRDFFLRLPS